MADLRAKILAELTRMESDGTPEEEIRAFEALAKQKLRASKQQNTDRAVRLEAVEEENSLGATTGRVLGDVWDRTKEAAAGIGRGAARLAKESVTPFGHVRLLLEPARRRELARGMDDTAFFGRAVPAADKLRGVLPEAMRIGPSYAESATADAAAAPGDRDMGRLMGAGTGGPALLAKGTMAGARALMPAVRPAIQGAYAGTVASTAAGAAAGGLEGANEGASSPLNALPLLGGAASAALRSNKTIGRFARSKERGTFQDPEMPQQGGAEGIQKAAERGHGKVARRMAAKDATESRAYHEAVDPRLDTPVDADALRMDILEGRQAHLDPDSGIPLRDDVDAAYNRAFDNTPETPTVRGTLARRRALQQDAAYESQNPSEKQLANREVYQTFRRAVRNASPEVAAADDRFTAHAGQRSRANDILYNTEENVIPSGNAHPDALPIDYADAPESASGRPRVGKERSAVSTLKRIDDDNEPGLRAARYLEELAEMDPAFAQALDFIAAKKSQVGTRFSLKGLKPTSLTGATEFGGWGPTARQNARALGAQVLDPLAQSAISPGPLRMHPLLQKIADDKERQRRLAEKMTRNASAARPRP